MNRLWAIDRSYSEQLRSIQEMPLSVQDRKDLQTAFEELEEPYWIEGSSAYIKIQGVLSRRWTLETWLLGGFPTPHLQHIFQRAAADPQVDQIVLLMDSPGGEVSGLSEFAQVIRECQKPVHAHVSGHCTSGAYWLASQADRITGSKTSMVGSIGAFISFIKLKDSSLFEEVIFRSSIHKAPDPKSKEGQEDYQQLVDGIAEIFEADVASGRGLPAEKVRELYGQGKVFLGSEALSLGMIDEIINKTEIARYPAQGLEMIGGSMDKEKQNQVEVETASQTPATADTGHAAAAAERDRIKGIMTLGGSEELTAQAIDEGMTVEAAAVKVNAELKARLDELKKGRTEDAKVLENVPQDPAADVVPAGGNVNALGIDRSQIDAELDKYTKKEA